MAPAWYPVPPKGYGGIELVVHLLAQELVSRGHRVTLFAAEGSDPKLHPIELAPRNWGRDLGTAAQAVREATYQVRVTRELSRRARDFDAVHVHTEYCSLAVAPLLPMDCPVLATIHGAIDERARTFLSEVDEDVDLVAISKAQRAQARRLRWRRVVHNAVPAHNGDLPRRKGRYLLQLARITPDKGQHLAVEVAERVGMPLVLAGKVDRDVRSREYFETEIKPRLSRRVRYLQDVRGRAKADLVAKAAAMLFPIQWEEPFGLAMVEAMVSGTPVVALRRGAAAEVVEPGCTGFLCDTVEELVDAVRRVGEVDPEACAARARKRFSPARMADGYLAAYRESISEFASRRGSSGRGGRRQPRPRRSAR